MHVFMYCAMHAFVLFCFQQFMQFIWREYGMPTISFIQPKGGAGKSTSALILPTELAKGAKAGVIDADPNAPIAKWASRGAGARNLEISQAGEKQSTFET